uniref:Putative glycosyl hydrolase family5 n=1 Tax=uncultured symbiotic protist of Cryptocercus punctulatus TaxID=403662 RepID=A4UX50_9EUKA|nr:putative glycosyl hydrolase family5 [uncultured symbiotic protist of Cryptocercus punctulatus]
MLAVFLSFSLSAVVQLSVKGNKIVGPTGTPVVSHGVSLFWHNWAGIPYTAATVTSAASCLGAKVIRAAIGVEPDGDGIAAQAGYLTNPQLALTSTYAVVDGAVAEGIYVIIDWHQHQINLNAAKEYFTTVAKKYTGVPNVIYEVYNEPAGPSWSEVKAYAIEVIKVIRQYDTDNVILVGTPQWDQKPDEAANSPITGYDNIAYTLHFYAGSHGQWLRDAGDKLLSAGYPIYVSECGGMNADGDGGVNTAEWNNWVSWMAKNDISWATWSLNNKAESASLITANNRDICSANALTEWGRIVKAAI